MTGNRKEFSSSYSRKSSHARMSISIDHCLCPGSILLANCFRDFRNVANSAKIAKVKRIFTFAKYRKNSKISKFDKILD